MITQKNKKHILFSCLMVLVLVIAVACSATGTSAFPENMYILNQQIDFLPNVIPLAEGPVVSMDAAPAVPTVLMPKASGKTTYANTSGSAVIDASNTADGYVMIKYTGTSTAKLKVIITGESKENYTYNLNNKGDFEVFPLSDGNGEYKIGVYQNVSGNKYSTLFSKAIKVELKDEFAPFLLPNQYVNYSEDSEVVKKAAELTKDCKTDLEKIEKVYKFVVDNFTYDQEKAATVQSGYLPEVDKVLAAKKGICFDYAAVMASMLRSQNVPCKLVVGYTGEAYHAWINTYLEGKGWVQGVIYFNGKEWKLMDPTFASSSKSSAKIMEYIGNGKNYEAKFLY